LSIENNENRADKNYLNFGGRTIDMEWPQSIGDWRHSIHSIGGNGGWRPFGAWRRRRLCSKQQTFFSPFSMFLQLNIKMRRSSKTRSGLTTATIIIINSFDFTSFHSVPSKYNNGNMIKPCGKPNGGKLSLDGGRYKIIIKK